MWYRFWVDKCHPPGNPAFSLAVHWSIPSTDLWFSAPSPPPSTAWADFMNVYFQIRSNQLDRSIKGLKEHFRKSSASSGILYSPAVQTKRKDTPTKKAPKRPGQSHRGKMFVVDFVPSIFQTNLTLPDFIKLTAANCGRWCILGWKPFCIFIWSGYFGYKVR